ncbi:Fe-S-cluster oxidoreductase [Thiorhodococcus minor]|nr:Fe-S-cluster oxidoreductase [Thiorhodococcus minor]
MPHGKPAGVTCAQLDDNLACKLFGSQLRPAVCASLAPSLEMCGSDRDQALSTLEVLEQLTAPRSAD